VAQHVGVEPADAVLVGVEDLGGLLGGVVVFHHHVPAGKAEAAGFAQLDRLAVGAHEFDAQTVVYLADAEVVILVEQRRGAGQRAAALAVAAAVQNLGAAAVTGKERVDAFFVGDVQLVAAAGGILEVGQIHALKLGSGGHIVIK